MNFFRRPDYRSEVTQFIDKLKTAKPTLEAEQRQGRALLWDKKIDRQAVQEQQEARVAQQPYVYQTEAK
jgi:Tfp pilus assembly protein PilV